MQHGNDKRHKFANGGYAVLALPQGNKNHHGKGERGDEFAKRRTRGGGLGDFFAQSHNGVIHIGKTAGGLLLPAKQFDHLMPLVHFVDHVIQRADGKLRAGNDAFEAIAVIARQQRKHGEHQGDY